MPNVRRLARAAIPLILAACAATGERTIERDVALATFDEAWLTVRDTHFDPELNGVDWDAVRAELRPRAAAARDDDELRAVVNEMLGRLGQSHFGMMPRSALPALDGSTGGDGDRTTPEALAGDVGIDVRIRDGLVLVSAIRAGGPAGEAGVRPGWALVDLNGDDLTARVERVMGAASGADRYATMGLTRGVVQRLVGPIGSTVPLAFHDGEERSVELELTRAERDVVAHDFGTNLPTFYLRFESEILERGGKRVGRIHFTNWFLPMQAKIDAAVDAMRDCDGIVIDLRDNGGGAGAMVMGTAGHFFEERTKLGVSRSRESTIIYNAMPRKVNAAGERVRPYAGHVAILTDELTGSASEIFAGGMQSVGRARVFGETSAGAVLPATTRTLANGDGLLFAMGDYATATGEQLEGVGVVPDVAVPLTRAGLLAGGDPALEAAVDWIVSGPAE